jgi:hypothetical protein
MGVMEAVNGNITALLRRGRGYRDLNYLLLKAKRLAASKAEYPCSSESRIICAFLQILVQRPIFTSSRPDFGHADLLSPVENYFRMACDSGAIHGHFTVSA